MNFVGGKARFVSAHSKAVYWPLGAPGKTIINNEVVLRPAPVVEFDDSLYATADPAISVGLFDDKTNFDRKWGFQLDASCLPKELREFWSHMSTETRRLVGSALARGKTIDEAFDLIPKEEVKPFTGTGEPEESYLLHCTEKGCRFIARGENPQQILVAHRMVAHRSAVAV